MHEIKVKEIHPFINPLYICEDMGMDLDKIRTEIDSMVTDPTLWEPHQDYRMQSINTPDVSRFPELFAPIDQISRNFIYSWGVRKPVRLKSWWVNIDEDTSATAAHSHSNGLLSGVFYVTAPEGCGDITFERPDAQEYQYKADEFNSYSYQFWRYKPVENSCLFFPSYMKHRVEISRMKDKQAKRVSIAFDYTYDLSEFKK